MQDASDQQDNIISMISCTITFRQFICKKINESSATHIFTKYQKPLTVPKHLITIVYSRLKGEEITNVLGINLLPIFL